jgi:hypothetical protein
VRNFWFLLLLASAAPAEAQRFYENGLLYRDETLRYFKSSFDSLNQAWLVQQMPTPKSGGYLVTHTFRLDTLVTAAKADMEAGISFSDFRRKYPSAQCSEHILNRVYLDKDYKGRHILNFTGLFESASPDLPDSTKVEHLKNRFVIDHFNPEDPATHYGGYLNGLFIEQVVEPRPLAKRYADWVQYHNFLTGKEPLFLHAPQYYNVRDAAIVERPHRDRFFEYIRIPNLPQPDSLGDVRIEYIDCQSFAYFSRDIRKQYSIWQEKRDLHIREHLDEQPEFKMLLAAAVQECLRLRLPDALLEQWAFAYLESDVAWQLARMRRVTSGCGNDPAPTRRVYEIGQMNALEVLNPRLMLLVQLYLIKDRTDWSYGFKRRFVGELEALGVDVPALLLGSMLQTDTFEYSYAHMQVGWALQNCKNHEEIAEMLRQAIADEALDDQNRVLLYVLYRHMLQRKYLEMGDANVMIETEIEPIRQKLPGYLQKSVAALRR